jgi:hypothetical protein
MQVIDSIISANLRVNSPKNNNIFVYKTSAIISRGEDPINAIAQYIRKNTNVFAIFLRNNEVNEVIIKFPEYTHEIEEMRAHSIVTFKPKKSML